MIRLPQPIPYQGSKRNIAGAILRYVPHKVERLVEPFAGSAAISIAASYMGLANRFLLNDINQPLAQLLQKIIHNPGEIADQYTILWTAQLGREREYYDEIRNLFNRTQAPDLLLYLLARCVKASVRYNSNGEFNQSPDNRRKGRHPQSMKSELLGFSAMLKDRTDITSLDFQQTIDFVEPTTDFVYLDPPYQGTSGTRDARYLKGISLPVLVDYLSQLNKMNVLYALSYDGIKGEKTYGIELPDALRLQKILLNAGRSTQSTLIGRDDITYESLYLSPALVRKLEPRLLTGLSKPMKATQAQVTSSQQLSFEIN